MSAAEQVAAAEQKLAAAEQKLAAAKEELAVAKQELAAAGDADKAAGVLLRDAAVRGVDTAQRGVDTAQRGVDTAQRGVDTAQSAVSTLQDIVNQYARRAAGVGERTHACTPALWFVLARVRFCTLVAFSALFYVVRLLLRERRHVLCYCCCLAFLSFLSSACDDVGPSHCLSRITSQSRTTPRRQSVRECPRLSTGAKKVN